MVVAFPLAPASVMLSIIVVDAQRNVTVLCNMYIQRIQSFACVCLAKFAAERVRSAIHIQRMWQRFVCYADYMFTIVDIVIVQSLVCAFMAKQEVAKCREICKIKAI